MAKKDCPECEGTGWKPIELDGIRRVERCSCNEAMVTERLLEQAGIPRRYEHCAFENFDIRKDRQTGLANPSLSRAKLYAQGFVNEYPTDFGLLFVGPTGVGKTHLAVAILRALMISKGVGGLFQDFQDLLKQIRESYNPISQTTESRVLAPVLETEVLLLDELMAPNASEWVRDTLAYIINSRYNGKRVTLITTTLPFEEGVLRGDVRAPSGENIPRVERTLADLGVTLRSRLYEMCKVIEMQSDDYRKAIKQAGYKFHVE
jgi:DNA replication protein DnaC